MYHEILQTYVILYGTTKFVVQNLQRFITGIRLTERLTPILDSNSMVDQIYNGAGNTSAVLYWYINFVVDNCNCGAPRVQDKTE